MTVLIIAAALIGSFVGLLLLTQATLGVGLICYACFWAIICRMLQAEEHHKQQYSHLTDCRGALGQISVRSAEQAKRDVEQCQYLSELAQAADPRKSNSSASADRT